MSCDLKICYHFDIADLFVCLSKLSNARSHHPPFFINSAGSDTQEFDHMISIFHVYNNSDNETIHTKLLMENVYFKKSFLFCLM